MPERHLICAFLPVEWNRAKTNMNLPWKLSSHPSTTVHTCDVAIIGATLPSVWLGIELTKKGFSVSILEHRSHIACTQELRQLGTVQLGLLDNFWRIAQGMGENAAHEIYRASQRGTQILRSLTNIRTGGWMLSKDERERQELNKLYALYKQWGTNASMLSKKEISEAFPSGSIYTGIQHKEEGSIHPEILTSTLSLQAQEHDVSICSSVNIKNIEDHNGGVRIHHQHGFTDSDVIIYMQHDQMHTLEPFFSTTLTTVRMQSISYLRTSPYISQACTTQYGYIRWRDEGLLRLISGCRWATPHLEQGEVDDTITIPAIEAALVRTVQQCFDEEEVHVQHRWSMIERKGCDGLPLVGALPGRDHVISCTAFQGRLLGLGFAGAESILELLDTGKTSTLPTSFSLRRFIV